MNDETEQKKSGKKNIFKVICTIVITLSVLYLILMMIGLLAFRPTIINKKSFSESEKSIIASELDIPVEKISIQKMRYTHARETDIYITVTTSSLDVLTSYEYQGKSIYDDDKPYYRKKGESPHDDIICVVKSEQPYELYFELIDTWNDNLYAVVK